MSNLTDPSIQRLVCLSGPSPLCSARDVLDVCHGYPDRKTQSCLGGKLLCVGEQFVLMLEGPRDAVEGVFTRIQRQVPAAEMTVRSRDFAADRAFRSWAIEDLYFDEVRRRDESAADRLADLLIELLSDADPQPVAEPSEEGSLDEAEAPRDPFAEVVALVERHGAIDEGRQVAA